jgi:hypothetical protein
VSYVNTNPVIPADFFAEYFVRRTTMSKERFHEIVMEMVEIHDRKNRDLLFSSSSVIHVFF